MELISRREAINAFIRWNKKEFGYSDLNREMRFIDEIESLPTIEERKVGHWIKHFDDMFPGDSTIECSVCHEEQYTTIDDNFCPNCGARMKGE